VGIGGEIPLKNKNVRLIQMSVEEDSCREVSDIGHRRIYRTDRLGMPLIETVTYPDMKNPDEVREACNYIRFLNRSTGKVRTGIGAGREDVNVSCAGGTRVEIKGVSRTKWIPELTHVEAFRQWALLAIREELKKRIAKEDWKMQVIELNPKDFHFYYVPVREAIERKEKLYAVNLPKFGGLLSHFTQPTKPFYDEFTNRLKVIACIEKPNMATSEDIDDVISNNVFEKLQKLFNAGEEDAQIIFWSPEADVKTALETIEERAKMTFDGVPNETRKSFVDGTTIFERVLPGADRMYPDTDSSPIPISNAHIDNLRKNVPDCVSERYAQLVQWDVPQDCYYYIFTHNYFPLIKKMVDELKLNPKYIGVFFGQKLKHLHGQHQKITFDLQRIYDLFAFLQQEKIEFDLAYKMLKLLFLYPKMEFDAMLVTLKFNKTNMQEIAAHIPVLNDQFVPQRKDTKEQEKVNAIMGQLRLMSEGNVNLMELANKI
jgi:glutamyl-tRNA(Gln) amidotransferase subunit E